ncbi:hypothetical protein QQX98_000365 [Neonectria punicea]|uniref:Uncharacterized protein n=1 Tax=Neonectria punicea TaxID=979145 RepID=A0ABR1HUR5_9HYPO
MLPPSAAHTPPRLISATIEEQGEASRPIEFTTIEKLFNEINRTTGDMLLIRRVSVQQFAGIEEAIEQRGMRFRLYYTPTKALIITIPTGSHERLHSELWDTTPVKATHQEVQAQNAIIQELGQP